MSFFEQIPSLRLRAQHLESQHFTDATELVSYIGALQAQDFFMVKWAVGLRLGHGKEKDIEELIDQGKLLRTHLLRPTWHLVSAKDIYWLLDLTAPHIKAAQAGRHRQLGITGAILTKSHAVIEKALGVSGQLSREELVAELEKAHIVTNENRASHLLFMAELDGLICSGKGHGKNSSYALLEERVPKHGAPLSREEALAKLTLLYFKSRGPATLSDYVNWSNLSISEAKKGLASAKAALVSEKDKETEYWWDPAHVAQGKEQEGKVHLLPSFDEYLLAYKDRTAVLQDIHQKKAIGVNGIFWPTIVLDGQVIGIWKRKLGKEKVVVEIQLFKKLTKIEKEAIQKETDHYAHFIEMPLEVKF